MNLIPVSFHNDTIDCVQEPDGNVWVSLKRLCENIGVTFSPQLNKLKKAPWATVTMIDTVGSDGKSRPMAMLPLHRVPMWLGNIEPSKVRAAIRPTLVRYQLECADVLANHFGFGRKNAPDLDVGAILDRVDSIDRKLARLLPQEVIPSDTLSPAQEAYVYQLLRSVALVLAETKKTTVSAELGGLHSEIINTICDCRSYKKLNPRQIGLVEEAVNDRLRQVASGHVLDLDRAHQQRIFDRLPSKSKKRTN